MHTVIGCVPRCLYLLASHIHSMTSRIDLFPCTQYMLTEYEALCWLFLQVNGGNQHPELGILLGACRCWSCLLLYCRVAGFSHRVWVGPDILNNESFWLHAGARAGD